MLEDRLTPTVGVVSFQSATFAAEEGDIAVITLTRTGDTTWGESASIRVTGGTATWIDDYAHPVLFSAAFKPGEATTRVLVPITSDTVAEPSETVVFTIDNAFSPGMTVGLATTTLTITDDTDGQNNRDDPSFATVSFQSATYSAEENDIAVITLTRTGDTSGEMYASVRVSGGTASPGDYAMYGARFSPGEATAKLLIKIKGDAIVEPSETLVLTLYGPTPPVVPGNLDTTTLTITDDTDGQNNLDDPSFTTVSFQSATYSAEENDVAVITLTRTGDISDEALVAVRVSGGTATPDDYAHMGMYTVVFAPGETTARLLIKIKGDAVVEPSETLVFTLYAPTPPAMEGYQDTTTLTITDDTDGQNNTGDPSFTTISFQSPSYTVTEGGTAVLTLTRTGDTSREVYVSVRVSGTATPDDYFHMAMYTVVFLPGEATATLVIPITDDLQGEPSETVVFTLYAPTPPAVEGYQDTTTLTILDNDGGPPSPDAVPVGSDIQVTAPDGTTTTFAPFAGFGGAVAMATGDVNGDGVADVIAAASVNGHVKVFDGATGAEIYSFFAFDGFNGAVKVATGDIDNDGFADIIVSAGVNGHVKAFSGATGLETRSFFAFAGFDGDVRVAAGDVDNDGFADIIVSANVNGHVKTFSGETGAEVQSFFAYAGFNGDVNLWSGDVDNDGAADIVSESTTEHVKVFSGATGEEIGSFFAPDDFDALAWVEGVSVPLVELPFCPAPEVVE